MTTTSRAFAAALAFATIGLIGSMTAYHLGHAYLSTPIALSFFGVALLMGLVERGMD